MNKCLEARGRTERTGRESVMGRGPRRTSDTEALRLTKASKLSAGGRGAWMSLTLVCNGLFPWKSPASLGAPVASSVSPPLEPP